MSNEAVVAVIDALSAANVPYMLVGSYSSNYYGIARATRDADFVIQVEPNVLIPVLAKLERPFRIEPQLSFETVTATFRQIVRLDNSEFKIELFYLSDDPHDQERFRRRRMVDSMDRRIYVPSPEDVVIAKLRWCRQGKRKKDREDVLRVVQVLDDRLDWGYLEKWCDAHGTRSLLDDIRREAKGSG
jgi:hypothetical protein